MATSKKTAPKDSTSEKNVKKKNTSEEIKKKPVKESTPQTKSKIAEKAKPVSKEKENAVKAKIPSKAKTDKASKASLPKDKVAEVKLDDKKAGKTKAKTKVETKNDDKVGKVIAAVKTKGKKSVAKIDNGKTATAPVPASKAAKKTIVAVFTLDNVREILQNRSDEARVEAEKKEAAAKKADTSVIIPETPQNRVLGAATLADILGFKIAVKKSEDPEREDSSKREIPDKFRKYYDMLVSLRDRIQKKINRRSHIDKDSDEDAPIAVPAQTDEDDSFDHDFALSLVANEQEALVEINAAVDRILDGTYGICEITGRPISSERLDAVPFARYSVEGQAQFEMQNRRRSQRTTAFLDSSDDAGIFSGEDADE